jgi:hypothetical protein
MSCPLDKVNTAIVFGMSFIAPDIVGLLAAILQHWCILERRFLS